MRRALIALGIILLLHQLSAQNRDWFLAPAVQLNGNLSTSLGYFVGVEPEFNFDDDRFSQIDFSAGLSRPLGDFKLTASMVYRRRLPGVKGHEWRFWQQAGHQFKVSTFRIRNRIRIEERFRKAADELTYQSKGRIRYRLAMDTPLQGERLDPQEWYVNTSVEVLYDDFLDSENRERELRGYLGFGYQFLNGHRVEPALDLRFARGANGDLSREGLWRINYVIKI